MSGDILSDVLRAVRFRGAVFYYVEGASPWVAEAPPAREMIPAILPGAEHMIEFHGIVKGACWGAVAGESPVRLEEGDVILFPQGDAHVMSSAPGMRGVGADGVLLLTPAAAAALLAPPVGSRSPRRSSTAAGATARRSSAGSSARRAPFNPLLAALPRVLREPGRALGPDSWVGTFLRAVVAESGRGGRVARPCSSA